MSRPLPPYWAIPTAWAGLPPAVQAELGCALIEWTLAEFVFGDGCPDEYQYCTAEIRDEACERSQRVFGAIEGKVRGVLPDLFGPEPCPAIPDGGDPEWAWRDRDELLALRDELRAEGRKAAKRLAVVEERLRTFARPAEPAIASEAA